VKDFEVKKSDSKDKVDDYYFFLLSRNYFVSQFFGEVQTGEIFFLSFPGNVQKSRAGWLIQNGLWVGIGRIAKK
jgi:hypothetical protein